MFINDHAGHQPDGVGLEDDERLYGLMMRWHTGDLL